MSTDLSVLHQPVITHGKFLRRADSKFFLKAMRLDGSEVEGSDGRKGHGLNAKVELRARLAQLKAGHTTTLIVKVSEADAVMDVAAVLGLIQ